MVVGQLRLLHSRQGAGASSMSTRPATDKAIVQAVCTCDFAQPGALFASKKHAVWWCRAGIEAIRPGTRKETLRLWSKGKLVAADDGCHTSGSRNAPFERSLQIGHEGTSGGVRPLDAKHVFPRQTMDLYSSSMKMRSTCRC